MNVNTSVYIMLENCSKCIKENNLQEAEDLLNKALALDSSNAEVLRLLAVIKSLQYDHEKALAYINQSIQLNPSNAHAHSNKGNILKNLGHYHDAIKAIDISIELNPKNAEAHNNRAIAMHDLGMYEDAIKWYEKAIEIDPTYVEAYTNKGNTLEYLGRHEEAIECYNKATAINPSYIEAYWGKALSQLARGQFDVGWQNYESRWFRDKLEGTFYPKIPKLENIDHVFSKRILIWAEQGLGDTIQFCRYIKSLANYGADITFKVQKPLLNVLKPLSEHCQLISSDSELFGEYDFQSPLLSLPLIFRTTVETIPAEIPYLFAEPEKVKIFSERIQDKQRMRVGVIWNGGFRENRPDLWEINKRRNIEFETFSQLKSIVGVDFFSLQKGEPAESELLEKKSTFWPNLINCVDWLDDFSDTAALMKNLDLIISVDTSSAHLAGALGKPVWILNRYDSCWRWLRGRGDSPWYPSAKIYQQKNPGDWSEVICRVSGDLLNLTKQAKSNH